MSWVRTSAGRLRTPWRLLLAGGLFFVVTLALSIAFLLVGVPLDPESAAGAELAVVLVVFIANGIALSAAALVAARYIDRRLLADIGVTFDSYWWRDFGVGAALGVGLVGGAYAVGVAIGVYDATIDPAAPSGYPLAVWLALAAGMMVTVGVYEELLVRGYALTNLAEGFTAFVDRQWAIGGALGISSLGFSLLHGLNPNATALGALTIGLAGLLLGLGYVLTGSLALPIGVHITWNLTHVLLGLPVSGLELGIRLVETETVGPAVVHGGAFGPEGGVLGTAAAVVGCLVVVAYGRGFRADIATPALRNGDGEESRPPQ